MKAFTDYARGKPCMIRIPQYCTGNPEETVACHVPLAGYHGTGIKMPPLFIAFGCAVCHDIVDGRRNARGYTAEDVRIAHLEGMIRTQAYILEHAPQLLVKLAS